MTDKTPEHFTENLNFEKQTAIQKSLEESALKHDDAERETIAQDGADFDAYHIQMFPEGHAESFSYLEMRDAFINARRKPRRILQRMWNSIHTLFKIEGFNKVVKELQKREKLVRDKLFRETGKVISLSAEMVIGAQDTCITQEDLIKAEFLFKHKLELTQTQYNNLEYVQSQATKVYIITLPSNFLESSDA